MSTVVERIRAWTRSRPPVHEDQAVAAIVIHAQPRVVRQTAHIEDGSTIRSVYLDASAGGVGVDLHIPDVYELAAELADCQEFLRGENGL